MCAFAPILVLRHELFEHLGYFSDLLHQKEIPYIYHDLGDAMPPGDPRAVIIMGGPMSANDSIPGLADELRVIDHALEQDVPVLGICLGAQLIAKALGARVYKNSTLEIGWEPVWLTDSGREDSLFRKIESPTEFFHWHGETFDLPHGAEWLAYSQKCRNQAYRYGRKVYGIQFHPEITEEMIADWCVQPVNCGDVATLTTAIDPKQANTGPLALQIFERWLDLGSHRSQGVSR